MHPICQIHKTCFDNSAINILSVSGGKDSLAQELIAKENNVNRVRIFADTGHEHPQTLEYLEYLETELRPERSPLVLR